MIELYSLKEKEDLLIDAFLKVYLNETYCFYNLHDSNIFIKVSYALAFGCWDRKSRAPVAWPTFRIYDNTHLESFQDFSDKLGQALFDNSNSVKRKVNIKYYFDSQQYYLETIYNNIAIQNKSFLLVDRARANDKVIPDFLGGKA